MKVWYWALAAAALAASFMLCAFFFYRFAMARRFGGRRRQPRDVWTSPPPVGCGGEDDPDRTGARLRAAEVWLCAASRRPGVRFETRSYDGLRLVAHYIPPACPPRAILLMVHGYRSSGLHDFACAAQEMHEEGFGCFIIDQRAHQESEGDTICFGVRERYDVRDWAALIGAQYPGTPVILDGISMGAASVMAAASLKLPPCVRGIIADCGYTSMRAIFEKMIRQWFHLPPFPLVPAAELICRMRCGFGFSDVQSGECLSHAGVPALMAHGTGDTFVPYRMSVEIWEEARASADVELFSAEGAEHGMSYLSDHSGYRAALARFFEKCLNKE